MPFALGKSGCDLLCATGLGCIISALQIVPLSGLKVTRLAGGKGVWVSGLLLEFLFLKTLPQGV